MSSESSCQRLTIAGALIRLPTPDGKQFATVFEHGSLSVEIYAPRGSDPQQPHTRDELYFVASGSGDFVCGETSKPFGPTDCLFAAAGVPHQFDHFDPHSVVSLLSTRPNPGE